jgi:uncharacterized damage-inducible protein DinB
MIAQMLLPELESEMATMRKVCSRIPEASFGYQPHEKSMTMGRLAGHIAEMLSWGTVTLQSPNFDINPGEGSQEWEAFVPKTSSELMEKLERSIKEFRTALEAVSDEAMQEPWSLLSAGQTLFTMPRIACVRSMILNHLIHHRGQLSVYLRLNNIPVPSIYGPSADEAQ